MTTYLHVSRNIPTCWYFIFSNKKRKNKCTENNEKQLGLKEISRSALFLFCYGIYIIFSFLIPSASSFFFFLFFFVEGCTYPLVNNGILNTIPTLPCDNE